VDRLCWARLAPAPDLKPCRNWRIWSIESFISFCPSPSPGTLSRLVGGSSTSSSSLPSASAALAAAAAWRVAWL
jgi:hypothetical protein